MKTKRRISISLVVIFLTICMFIGSTFAWFTSETVVKNNIIKGGELGVGLSHLGATMSEEQKTLVVNADADDDIESIDLDSFYDIEPYVNEEEGINKGIFDEDTLWEPGASHCEVVKVTANKDFSVKFKMYFGPDGAFDDGDDDNLSKLVDEENVAYAKSSSGLLSKASAFLPFEVYTKSFIDVPAANAESDEDVWPGYENLFEGIDSPSELIEKGWTFNDLSINPLVSVAQGEAKKGDYEVGDEYHSIVAIVVKLKEFVGNEWQGIDNAFDIKLIATQLNADEDAYTKDYDKDAGFVEAKYYTDYADYALINKGMPANYGVASEHSSVNVEVPNIVSLDRGESYDWLLIDEKEGLLVKKTPAFVIDLSKPDSETDALEKINNYEQKEYINEKFAPLLVDIGKKPIEAINEDIMNNYKNVLYLLSPGENESKGFLYKEDGNYTYMPYSINSSENALVGIVGYHPVIRVNKDIVEFVKRDEIAILVEKENVLDVYKGPTYLYDGPVVDFSYTSDNFDVYVINESQQLLVSFADRFDGGNVKLPAMFCESDEIIPFMADVDMVSMLSGRGLVDSIKKVFFGEEIVEDVKDDMTIIMAAVTKPSVDVYTDQYGNEIIDSFMDLHVTEVSNKAVHELSPRFVITRDNGNMTMTSSVSASQNTVDATLERFRDTLITDWGHIVNSKAANSKSVGFAKRSMFLLLLSDIDIISEDTVENLIGKGKNGLKTLVQSNTDFFVRANDGTLKLMSYDSDNVVLNEIVPNDFKNHDVHFEFEFKKGLIDYVNDGPTKKVYVTADKEVDGSPIQEGTKLLNYGRQSVVVGEKDNKWTATFDVVPGGEINLMPEKRTNLKANNNWCFAEQVPSKEVYYASDGLTYSKSGIESESTNIYVYPRLRLYLYSDESIFEDGFIKSNIINNNYGSDCYEEYTSGDNCYYSIDILNVPNTTINLPVVLDHQWKDDEGSVVTQVTLNGTENEVLLWSKAIAE